MRTRTISRYALGVAAAAMITVPTAGVAGAIPIIPSDGGSTASAENTADTKDTGSREGSSGTISGVGDDAKTESGSDITSTVTTTTTPAAEDDEDVTLDEPAATEAPTETPAATPNEEDLAVTGNSTQVFAGALAVLAVMAAGGYVFAMRRTKNSGA